MKNHIHNSTFMFNHTNMENLWNESSVSSVKESLFAPVKIKKVVDSLVMSRFGDEYNRRFSKSHLRRSKFYSTSLSSCGSCDYSIGTSSVSQLISSSSLYSNPVENDYYEQSAQYLNMDGGSPTYIEIRSPDELKNSEIVISEDCSYEINKNLLVLNETKKQILKAIYYAELSSNTGLSRERLEAERLLLITDLAIDLRISETKSSSVEYINDFCSGTVEISSIYMWLKESHFDRYFICLVTYKNKVFSSEISQVKSNGVLHFKNTFTIKSLPPDFNLSLKIYTASKKDFKKIGRHFACGYSQEQDNADPFRSSSFKLWGEADIKLHDLSKSDFILFRMKDACVIARISSFANLNMNISGFLNVGELINGACPLWNQQWCSLRGRYLQFFNNSDEEQPNGVVDLGTSVELRLLSREECPRKQTLLLNTISNNILLSSDLKIDFEFWERYLMRVVLGIKIWEN